MPGQADICRKSINAGSGHGASEFPDSLKTDICDRDSRLQALFEEEKPDVVDELSQQRAMLIRTIENPEIFLQDEYYRVRQCLMDACRKYGIQRYHQVSTDEVYGDLPLDRPDLVLYRDAHPYIELSLQQLQGWRQISWSLAYHRTYGLACQQYRSCLE